MRELLLFSNSRILSMIITKKVLSRFLILKMLNPITVKMAANQALCVPIKYWMLLLTRPRSLLHINLGTLAILEGANL